MLDCLPPGSYLHRAAQAHSVVSRKVSPHVSSLRRSASYKLLELVPRTGARVFKPGLSLCRHAMQQPSRGCMHRRVHAQSPRGRERPRRHLRPYF